jgi:hypothetical protein
LARDSSISEISFSNGKKPFGEGIDGHSLVAHLPGLRSTSAPATSDNS